MIVVLDTSTLLNFLRIGRTDLIAAHPFTFVTVQEVADEVSHPESRDRYEKALAAGHIEQRSRGGSEETRIFSELQAIRFGAGESAAIAVALNRDHGLSLDDGRAAKHAKAMAQELGKSPTILKTRDIVVDLIRSGELSVEQADSFLAEWADKHKFRLKISSFSECVADCRKR